MATVGPSFFQIPADKVGACVKNGVLSSTVIASVGCAALGAINSDIEMMCIVATPLISVAVMHRHIPEVDDVAIYIGSAIGAVIPTVLGGTTISLVGSIVVAGLATTAIAAARIRPIP